MNSKTLWLVLFLFLFTPLWGQEGKSPKAKEKEIENWIDTFSHPDKSLRLEASKKLAKIGPQALPSLIKALSHKNWLVRYYAARTLASMKGKAKKAVPALTERLFDSDLRVRCHAARALAAIGPPAKSALPSLIRGLSDPDWRIRCYFTYAIGQIGDDSDQVKKALRKSLHDFSTAVRKIAIQAMGNSKSKDYAPILIRAFRKEKGPLKEEILQVLAQLRAKESVPLFLDILVNGKKKNKALAKEGLLKMGKTAREALKKEVARENQSPQRIITAMEILGLYSQHDKKTIRLIIDHLDHSNIDIRSAARQTLEKMGPSTIPHLLSKLGNQPPSKLEKEAQKVLQQWGKASLNHIVEIGATTENSQLKEKAQNYLRAQKLKALPSLIKGLKHKSYKVRSFAATQLGKADRVSPLVFNVLIKAAREDSSKRVQKSAREALANLKNKFSPQRQDEITELLGGKKEEKTTKKPEEKTPDKPEEK